MTPGGPETRRPEQALPVRDLPSLAVRRPVLAIVASLLIVIAGLAALGAVEVRELPEADRPVVTVRAAWPGAAPETVDAEVTRVLEGAVARVSGMRDLRATSSEGSSRVRVEFAPGTNLDTAANDVREAVARVERRLPDGVEDVTVVKADDNASPVVQVAVVSDTLSQEALTRLAEDIVATELAAVPGVAGVQLFGDRRQVLRVLLDPLRLASFGLAVDDVAQVLRSARFDVPAGSFRTGDQQLIVRAEASVTRPDDLLRLRLADRVQLGDVARVFYGPADAGSTVRLDGRAVVAMGVIRQAQSNTIEISAGVDRAIERLNRGLGDAWVQKSSDDAVFIRGSVREVLVSLGLAVLVVFAVTFLFLGSLRTVLIPAVAIPVSLIGTLAAIWLLGFSVNILTLLAMVLATGLIVDDAIVVTENIQRRRAQGLRSMAAAVLGTRQVFFAVIATTATLAAVFLPIAFLPSTAGRMFAEFGFVLAIAVAISSFVALTLCPMLASRLPAGQSGQSPLVRRAGAPLAALYRRLLDAALAAPLLVTGAIALLCLLAALLFGALRQELVPPEDRGVILVSVQGPDGADLDYMERQVAPVEAALRPLQEDGTVASIFTIVGRGGANRALVLARLAPWGARAAGQAEIAAGLQAQLADLPGATIRLFSPNSLNLRGGSADSALQFALTGTSHRELADTADLLVAAAVDRVPGLADMRLSFQATTPQLAVRIDRRRAEDLGIPVDGLTATLRAMVAGYEVTELNVEDSTVPILLQSAGGAVTGPSDLNNLFVRSGSDRMVPLSAIIAIEEQGEAAQLERAGQRRAVQMSAALPEGYALRQAVDDLERLAAEVLPPGTGILLQGEAAALDETSHEVLLTLGIAFLVILLLLAAQFESFVSAAVIVITLPSGLAAAILALHLTGTSVNIYSQIGLVMLVGLMAKNGILIVEFADQLRDQGLPVARAIREASLVRLRPVMMTMLSTVFGALPLILSAGPGAEARAAIGWVVFGGLGIATLFTLFLTPAVYRLLAPLARPRADAGARLAREMAEAEGLPDSLSGTLSGSLADGSVPR